MRLNPPTVFIFLISLLLVGIGLASRLFLAIPEYVPHQQFWLVVAGYIVLVLGNLIRGL